MTRDNEPVGTAIELFDASNFKRIIGLGKSDKAPDGSSVEILIYPEGTVAAQNPAAARFHQLSSLFDHGRVKSAQKGGQQ